MQKIPHTPSTKCDQTLQKQQASQKLLVNSQQTIQTDRVKFLNLTSKIHPNIQKTNKKVYILYTSGCVGANQKLEIEKDFLKDKMMSNSYLCDYKLTLDNKNKAMVSPVLQDGHRVQYFIESMNSIQASINASIQEVAAIANKIQQNYSYFDAFIIISGFDLMCYSSTILSFMLENLGKTVIFTGGNFPISFSRNDFINNMIQSFSIISLSKNLNDVIIVCKNKGYRANRSMKVKQSQMDVIKSPNMHSLVSVDIKIRFKFHLFLPIPVQPFEVFTEISQKVSVIKFHIFINKQSLKYELQNPNIKGYVIESYTAANLPEDQQLLLIFKKASENEGKIFINISQNIYKEKNSIMKEKLEKYNIHFGGDMTVQAALAKLAYLLGKGYSRQEIVQRIAMNLRGQLSQTKNQNQFEIQTQGFMEAVQQVLQSYYPTATQKQFTSILQDQIGKSITHSLLPQQFKTIYKNCKTFNQPLSLIQIINRNNLLHRAVLHQNISLISYFLSLDIQRDRLDQWECSAFFYGIKTKNKLLIQLMYKSNCHVVCICDQITDFFVKQINNDNHQFFQLLYHIQFKNTLTEVLNTQKRNVAHLAALLGAQRCLDLFMNKFKFQLNQKDVYGSTVQDYIVYNKKNKLSKSLNLS